MDRLADHTRYLQDEPYKPTEVSKRIGLLNGVAFRQICPKGSVGEAGMIGCPDGRKIGVGIRIGLAVHVEHRALVCDGWQKLVDIFSISDMLRKDRDVSDRKRIA